MADVIEVLRQSSLITYENRRISTSVILPGPGADGWEAATELPPGAAPYTGALISIKSFHRLCDGLHTLFLVNSEGMLVDLVDVDRYARGVCRRGATGTERGALPAALPGDGIGRQYLPGADAERRNQDLAGGVQVFHFLEGRRHVTDMREKYYEFHQAIGDTVLAQRLFTAALHLAEHRRGGLFVVLDRDEAAPGLVAPEDLLENQAPGFANRVHYRFAERASRNWN